MGLLDVISGGLTAGTNAAAAQQKGELEGSQLMRQIMMQQAQLEHTRAETILARRHAEKPQENDPGYGGLMGGIEADKYAAQTPGVLSRKRQEGPIDAENAAGVERAVGPVRTENAVAQEGAMGPVRTRNAVAQGTAMGPVDASNAAQKVTATSGPEAQAALAKQSALAPGVRQAEQDKSDIAAGSDKMAQAVANRFLNSAPVKPLTQGARPYADAKNALALAKQPNARGEINTAAYKTALINYVRSQDPGLQMRQGILDYASRVDPSFVGNLGVVLQKLENAKLPLHIVQGMEEVMDRSHTTHAAMYEQQRRALLAENPNAAKYVPETQVIFGIPGVTVSPNSRLAQPQGGAAPGAKVPTYEEWKASKGSP